MKIGLAVRKFSPQGGLESNIWGLAHYLVDQGDEVHIVCQKAALGHHSTLHIHTLWIPSFLGNAFTLNAFNRRASQLLQKLKLDVSYTGSRVQGTDVVRLEGGVAAAYQACLQQSGQPLSRAEKAAAQIEAQQLQNCKRIIALSSNGAREVQQFHNINPNRVSVIENGVDLQRFQPLSPSKRKELRTQHQVNGLGVAFVGSGFQRKGLDRLIEGLAHPDCPPATLLVAGRDNQLSVYQSLARQNNINFRYLGYLDNPTDIYGMSDVSALLARYEPFGLVVLESLACGCPSLVSDDVGAQDVLKTEAPEWVIPNPCPPQKIAQALRRVPTEPQPEPWRKIATAYANERSYAHIRALLAELAEEQRS